MFTVSLKLVRPSPTPIRKTWDEDKMNELAASIKERGVIVPIKVRPVSDKFRECRMHGLSWLEGVQLNEHDESCFYCGELRGIHGIYQDGELEEDEDLERGKPFLEVVYGHRRVEAARRAGLEDIPALVEELEDEDAYTQQLAENESREDVTLEDKARGYRYGMDTFGWSQRETARRAGTFHNDVQRALKWLDEREQGTAVTRSSHHTEGWTGIDHTLQIRTALGDDVEAKKRVAEKVSQDGLTATETRAVADAYKAAETPELKEAVLNTSGKLGDADRILQVAKMKVGAAGLVERNEQERRQAFEEYDRAVKDFLDAMKLFDRMLKTARDAARYGKFSPEGARFAVGRIDKLIDELETLKEVLSHVDAN